MSKIGDLFVRLGLKKDDYSRGLKEAGRESESFASTLRGIGTKAAAVWAAIGVGAVALAGKFAQTTQRFGDLWDQTTAGMTAAWNQFTASLANFNFEGLGQRIKNAFNAARESSAAHDSEFEITNSLNLRKAEMREELATLQTRMRNQNLSYNERLEAQRQYLDKLRPLYQEEANMRRDIMLADTKEYLANAGLANTTANRDALKEFLTDVAPNSSLLNALDQYSKKNRGQKYKLTAQDAQMVDQFLSKYDYQQGGVFSALANYYQGTNDNTAKKVVDAIQNYYEAAGAFQDETRRVQQIGNSIIKSNTKAAEPKKDELVLADIDKAMEKGNRIVEERIRARQQILKELENDMAADYAEFESKLASDMDLLTQQALAPLKEANENALALGEEFHSAIIDGYVDGIQELMDQLAGLSDANPGAIFQALLTPLADMAVQEGKILMASGLGIEAIKTALESLNGVAAIVAGAALISLGSAAKSGLAAIAQGGSAGGYATYGAQGGGTMGTGGASTIATEMTINVTGRLDGRDIVLSGQRTLNQWGR